MDHDSYADFWGFIAEYLPNYYSRNDVLRSDILRRFLDDEELWESDLVNIQREFGSDKEKVAQELITLESTFAKEALENYFWRITKSPLNFQWEKSFGKRIL